MQHELDQPLKKSAYVSNHRGPLLYGGYDLTLGWTIIIALLALGAIVNLTNRKEAN